MRQNSCLQNDQHEWHINAVDYWLDTRSLKHDEVNQAIGPTDHDIAAIRKAWVRPTGKDLISL